MRKILTIALAALMALASCTKDGAASLDGKWDAPRSPEQADDIAFSLVFNGDHLDLYVIAWGQRYSGNYSYANDVVSFNVTSASQAYTDVVYEDGKIVGYSWSAGNLDPKTLKLASGYDWYDLSLSREDLYEEYKEMFSSFKFKLVGKDKAESDLMFEPVFTRQ